jgi:predicted phage terminase large subunit-like protein
MQTRRGTKLAVIAPRASAKSTWVSFAYPLHCAVHGTERYIQLICDSTGQAEKLLADIKAELEDNEALADAYPAVCGKPGPVWRRNSIRLANGVVIEALGTGSKIRGRRNRQDRPSLIIVDDPENEEHQTSALKRERSWNWFNRAAMNAGTDRTNHLVLGTSLHRECLVLRLQTQPGWQAKLFRAVVRWPERMDLWARWEEICHDWENPDREQAALDYFAQNRAQMERGAEVLWPEWEPLYQLMQLRATIGPAAFAAEKQGDPVDPTLCEWPSSYFDGPGFWFDEWPRNLELRVLSLDPSKGRESKRGDYSALVRIGLQNGGMLYVEADLKNDRDSQRIAEDAMEHVKEFSPDAFAVEVNSYQELLVLTLVEAAKKANLLHLPVHQIDNTVNKEVRIRRLTTYLAQRKLRFKRRSPGTLLLVQQLRDFPVGDHDDGPDSLEQGIRVIGQIIRTANSQNPRRLRT